MKNEWLCIGIFGAVFFAWIAIVAFCKGSADGDEIDDDPDRDVDMCGMI